MGWRAQVLFLGLCQVCMLSWWLQDQGKVCVMLKQQL